MSLLLARYAPAGLGFLLTVNLYVLPHAGTSPRLTDLVALVLALWLLVHTHRHGIPGLPLAVAALVALLPLGWTAYSLLEHDTTTFVLAARWLLAVPWALALVVLAPDTASRTRFMQGLLVGAGVNALVVVMQYTGFDAPLRVFGIASTDSEMATWVMDEVRLPGLHRHYGASSAVTSLIAPAALYLYARGRHGIWLPLVALAALAVTLQLTFTRSPLLVTAVSTALALLCARRTRPLVILGATLLVVAIPALVIVGPPGGKARWTDELSFQANAHERFASTWAGIELAFEHPLGMGVDAAQTELKRLVAIDATHNAFVQAALFLGLPLAVMLGYAFVHHSVRLFRGIDDPGFALALLAVHVLGLFFFEEHLNNPTFVILASWLAAAAAQQLARPTRNGTPTTPSAAASH